jgi:hypothetical protein
MSNNEFISDNILLDLPCERHQFFRKMSDSFEWAGSRDEERQPALLLTDSIHGAIQFYLQTQNETRQIIFKLWC